MARNTAAQGAAFENAVIHYLEGCDCENRPATPKHVGWRGFGYECIRSAASKGAVDIVAVGSVDTTDEWNRRYDIRPNLLFIQCKLTNPQISPAERLAVQNLALRAGALPIVAWLQVDQNTRRKRPHFRLLTGPGPKEWLPWEPGEEN